MIRKFINLIFFVVIIQPWLLTTQDDILQIWSTKIDSSSEILTSPENCRGKIMLTDWSDQETNPSNLMDSSEAIFLHHLINDDLETVKIFLKNKINPNLRDFSQNTPLILVMKYDLENAVKLTKLLLKAGANPDLRDSINMTPLMYASYFGRSKKIIKMLIKDDARLNLKNNYGHRAIDFAQRFGYKKIVKLLIASGAEK
ncbi:ankyrin repeat domain-containing protein [Candidatus Dependentiae bacterium]|nr:ankyrin repeat domain-containing protein [Candidatus Dependentiae bacterium]